MGAIDSRPVALDQRQPEGHWLKVCCMPMDYLHLSLLTILQAKHPGSIVLKDLENRPVQMVTLIGLAPLP